MTQAQKKLLARVATLGAMEHTKLTNSRTAYALQRQGMILLTYTGNGYYVMRITDAGKAALANVPRS